MLRTKKADRIVAIFTAVMLIAAVCLWGLVEPVQGDGSHEIGYESLLFDKSRVHTIEITIKDWDGFLANATSEEYRECDITIDGEKLGTVGIRAKGNTSLSSVATLGSSRYSFKVEFDQYTKGKTYHGLDKLSLNNLIQDATMMKDYLAYTLMGEMGVPSPLCSYVQITVNGEPWGLYLAVEAVEDAFLERNGMTKGELYKPDSLSFGGGRGNGRDFDIENFREEENEETTENTSGESAPAESAAPDAQDGGSFGGSSGNAAGTADATQQMPQGGDFAGSGGDSAQQMPQGGDFAASSGESAAGSENGFPANGEMPEGAGEDGEGRPDFDMSQMGGFGGFNFGMGNDDVKLVYTDDDPDSYSNIFNNAKTNINKKDKSRLIESLRKLNAKEDLDNVVNKEEVTTYMAVHNFLCNDDSYTGMMVHNYYLYEENGKLTIIPWDYNLGFGGFAASANATSTVNSPIDNPVSSGTTDSRPLIGWIFSDEESLAAYHEVYDRFITDYIESGWLENEINRVQEMITPYVAEDPTAFFTMEEFEKAVSTLQTFCSKRGESIRGQLDGTIPSTTNGQRSSDALIDASDISTADMGSMNSSQGGGFEMPSGMPEAPAGEMPTGMPAENGDDGSFGGSAGGSSGESAQPEAGDDTAAPSTGEPAETPPAADETEPANTDMPAAPDETASENTAAPENAGMPEDAEGTEMPKAPDGAGDRQGPSGGGFPGGDFQGFGGYANADQSGLWIQVAICAGLLLAALLIIRKAGSHNNG